MANYDDLTDSQKLYVRYYLTNGNKATQAYLMAVPEVSEGTAASMSCTWMKEGHPVRRVINDEMLKLFHRFEITEERIVQEMACLAFYDPKDIFDENGNVKPIPEITEKARRVISGVEVTELYDTDDEGERVVSGHLKKLKVTSKEKALEMLARYHKMFVDTREITFPNGVDVRQVGKVDLDERIAQLVGEEVDKKVKPLKDQLDALLQ